MGKFTPFWETDPPRVVKMQIELAYRRALHTYIELLAIVETVMNEAIASSFLIDKKEQNDLIETLILELKAHKKVAVLRKILKHKKYKGAFNMYLEMLDELEKIIETRNKLAHAALWITDKFVQQCSEQKEIKRIPFRNYRWSNQTMYINTKEAKADERVLVLIIARVQYINAELIKLKKQE